MNKVFIFAVLVVFTATSCISNRYLLSGDNDRDMLKDLIRKGSKYGVMTKKPIVVVDGLPFRYGDLKQTPFSFSKNEVKSMEVLKRETAVKIYGSEGKNGCLLVTTTKSLDQRLKTLKDKTIYVVRDGKSITLEELKSMNPDEIESVEIIKDAEIIKKWVSPNDYEGVIIINSKK
jgi:hypothetical protein